VSADAGSTRDGAERPDPAFAFGRNWQRYIAKYLDPGRIEIAAQSLADLVGQDLAGKVFLDIGAGSGLFSLCASFAGDMYAALRNAARLVKPDGLLCIAIYNRARRRFLNSHQWWKIKRAYNHSPRFLQRAMEIAYLGYWVARQLYARKNPLRTATEYIGNNQFVFHPAGADCLQ
jgi:2-polyprenyl-6-hydroxyphenyl methylase/3-demethylubiquinone-9 3-methyltransferase